MASALDVIVIAPFLIEIYPDVASLAFAANSSGEQITIAIVAESIRSLFIWLCS
jgi:hypothetical protein